MVASASFTKNSDHHPQLSTPRDRNRKQRKGGGAKQRGGKPKGGVEVSPSEWVLPDRVGFLNWIQRVFVYPKEKEGGEDGTGSSSNGNETLFVRQRFVRDYLQEDGPYPGLLLYHAVGVGKSRASIAALRALEGSHRMFVMLKASIRNNFVDELRKFGGDRYAEMQEWAQNPDGIGGKEWEAVSEEGKRNGIRGIPFDQLPIAAKQEVRARLARIIEQDIRFVHYNGGITKGLLEEFCDGPNNPFEGAAIVIDEAHNFVSSVTKGGLAKHLYERMMTAEDRKVILLTGTPFVNDIVEMPYMLNLVRGFVRTLRIRVDVDFDSDDVANLEEKACQALEASPFVNRYEFDINTKGLSSLSLTGSTGKGEGAAGRTDNSIVLVVEPTPPGFRRIAGRANDLACSLEHKPRGNNDTVCTATDALMERDRDLRWTPGAWTADFVRSRVVQDMRSVTGKRTHGKEELTPLLPMGEKFIRLFADEEGQSLRNHAELERRAAGLVSYFAAYDKETFPDRSPKHIVKCPMSPHQFDVYKGLREEERRQERTAQRISHAKGRQQGTRGANDTSNSTYRTFTRQVCTFAFPSQVPRPYKKDVAKRHQFAARGEDIIADDDDDDRPRLSRRFLEGGAEKDAQARVEEKDDDGDDNDDDQWDEKEEGGNVDNEVETNRSPLVTTKENPKKPKKSIVAREYDRQLTRATRALQSPKHIHVLRMDGTLAQHSPKFYELIDHFSTRRNPMLVYSQFRKTEGIGLFAACLDANGYNRLSVSRDPITGVYRLRRERNGGSNGAAKGAAGNGPSSHGGSYMIFDNSDPEAARILLNAFNSEFDRLPASVLKDVKGLLPPGKESDENLHGNLAKLMLVTKSGAEGITLKNVREVHALEPYWNANRIDQVIGRAVRAHSHARLPPEERRVDIYEYMATFTPEQAAQRTIKTLDNSKTSDEYLYELALKKGEMIDDMLGVLRRAAVDCRMHREEHRNIDPDHACTPRLVGIEPDSFAYPLAHSTASVAVSSPLPLLNKRSSNASSSMTTTNSGKKNVLRAVRVAGKPYYMNPGSGKMYDFEALKHEGKLIEMDPNAPSPSPSFQRQSDT